MRKIWNPIKAYRNAVQRNADERTRYEAQAKICIKDYTDSKGNTYTALIINGIPAQRVLPENIKKCEAQLLSMRQEYIDKRASAI